MSETLPPKSAFLVEVDLSARMLGYVRIFLWISLAVIAVGVIYPTFSTPFHLTRQGVEYQGSCDYREGAPADANPFQGVDSTRAQWWLNGWGKGRNHTVMFYNDPPLGGGFDPAKDRRYAIILEALTNNTAQDISRSYMRNLSTEQLQLLNTKFKQAVQVLDEIAVEHKDAVNRTGDH